MFGLKTSAPWLRIGFVLLFTAAIAQDSDQPSAHVQLSRAYDFDFLGQCKAALCHAANDLFIRSIAFDGLPGLTRLFIAWHLVQIDAHDSRTGETALTTAVAAGKIEMVELLVYSGSSLTVPNRRGQSPLVVAAIKGHQDIVSLIASHPLVPPSEVRNAILAFAAAQKWTSEEPSESDSGLLRQPGSLAAPSDAAAAIEAILLRALLEKTPAQRARPVVLPRDPEEDAPRRHVDQGSDVSDMAEFHSAAAVVGRAALRAMGKRKYGAAVVLVFPGYLVVEAGYILFRALYQLNVFEGKSGVVVLLLITRFLVIYALPFYRRSVGPALAESRVQAALARLLFWMGVDLFVDASWSDKYI